MSQTVQEFLDPWPERLVMTVAQLGLYRFTPLQIPTCSCNIPWPSGVI